MRQVTFAIDERLATPGSTVPFAGRLDEAGYSVGEHDFSLPEGLAFDLVLTNAGEGVFASGMLTAHVLGVCDRCLERAEFDVEAEVDEYYLFHEPDSLQVGDGEDEADFSLVAADNTIDLTDALSSALIMETPFVVLCQEDCQGLCPVCGANLNEGDCGHASDLERVRESERLEASPFAALKDLRLED